MKNKCLILLLLSVFLSGCGKEAERAQVTYAKSPLSIMARKSAESMESAPAADAEIAQDATTTKRYLAFRHHLTVETEAANVKAQFEAAVKHCESLQCQMLNASFNNETENQPASAYLSVRVPPAQFDAFLNSVEKSTKILQHQRDSEDKTDAVIDVEARLKNATDLRDRLRKMLAEQPAKIKDILDIESKLSEIQAQIDSANGIRKSLSNETDWVAIDIQFQAKQGVTEKGFFAPIADALKNAGNVIVTSFASIITLMVALLPWLIIGVPLFLGCRKLWRKFKSKPA